MGQKRVLSLTLGEYGLGRLKRTHDRKTAQKEYLIVSTKRLQKLKPQIRKHSWIPVSVKIFGSGINHIRRSTIRDSRFNIHDTCKGTTRSDNGNRDAYRRDDVRFQENPIKNYIRLNVIEPKPSAATRIHNSKNYAHDHKDAIRHEAGKPTSNLAKEVTRNRTSRCRYCQRFRNLN
jgi:hypothetical protein